MSESESVLVKDLVAFWGFEIEKSLLGFKRDCQDNMPRLKEVQLETIADCHTVGGLGSDIVALPHPPRP